MIENIKFDLLKKIPKMDIILSLINKQNCIKNFSKIFILNKCKSVLNEIRNSILNSYFFDDKKLCPKKISSIIINKIKNLEKIKFKSLINATGILLHTNLGRSPISKKVLKNVVNVNCGYSNLEYDFQNGTRNCRLNHIKDILEVLTGAKNVLIVNNNAAAIFLILNTISSNYETILSRGELVEIGEGFRISEIIEKSGAILKEVGSTNITNIIDYEKAICEKTALLMKVDQSNFKLVGFTKQVDFWEIIKLSKRKSIPMFYDLGSGFLLDINNYYRFTTKEIIPIYKIIQSGIDILSFSGDKLLGGPQAGIILVNDNTILNKLKYNPLYRTLRVDKLTLSALEATLRLYLKPKKAIKNIRVLHNLTESIDSIFKRTKILFDFLIKKAPMNFFLKIKKGKSFIGGGTLPSEELPTVLIIISHKILKAQDLSKMLRRAIYPIVTRIIKDKIIIDMRTVHITEIKKIQQSFEEIFYKCQ